MAIVRILVDGYSLLHNWMDLAPGKPRNSGSAREELVRKLTQYYDASGTPLTIIFDGVHGPPTSQKPPSTPEVEVHFTVVGRPADLVIERIVQRLRPDGEVLAVTDSPQERDRVTSLGGTACGSSAFKQMVEDALVQMERDIEQINERERVKFTHAA